MAMFNSYVKLPEGMTILLGAWCSNHLIRWCLGYRLYIMYSEYRWWHQFVMVKSKDVRPFLSHVWAIHILPLLMLTSFVTPCQVVKVEMHPVQNNKRKKLKLAQHMQALASSLPGLSTTGHRRESLPFTMHICFQCSTVHYAGGRQ